MTTAMFCSFLLCAHFKKKKCAIFLSDCVSDSILWLNLTKSAPKSAVSLSRLQNLSHVYVENITMTSNQLFSRQNKPQRRSKCLCMNVCVCVCACVPLLFIDSFIATCKYDISESNLIWHVYRCPSQSFYACILNTRVWVSQYVWVGVSVCLLAMILRSMFVFTFNLIQSYLDKNIWMVFLFDFFFIVAKT